MLLPEETPDGRHGVSIHVLDHYGNYAGAVTPAEDMSSAGVIRRQVTLTADPDIRLAVARGLVAATAANVRWALDTDLLDGPLSRLGERIPLHDFVLQSNTFD